MKLNEYKKEYQDYSSKASDASRQLSFAGIAIIWIFKVPAQGMAQISNGLLKPLGLFCASLAFDLFQYLLGYVIWYFYFKHLEGKREDPNTEFEHRKIFPIPIHLCMWAKILAVISGYYYLLKFFPCSG